MALARALYVSRPGPTPTALRTHRLALEYDIPRPFFRVSGAEFSPRVLVTADDPNPVRFDARFHIDQQLPGQPRREVYSDLVTNRTVQPGTTLAVSFRSLTLAPSDCDCWAELWDLDWNQRLRFAAAPFYVVYVNAACTAILHPPANYRHPLNVPLVPIARVKNLTMLSQRFGCDFAVLDATGNLVWARRSVDKPFEANQSLPIAAPTPWTPRSAGDFTLQAASNLTLDSDPSDDQQSVQFSTGEVPYRDVQLLDYQFPFPGALEGRWGQPYARVLNRGRLDVQARFRMRILNHLGELARDFTDGPFPVYAGTTTIVPGRRISIPDGPQITVDAWAVLDGDERPENNRLGPTIMPITRCYNFDLACLATSWPRGPLKRGSNHTVSADFRNVGRQPISRSCRFDGLWKLDKTTRLMAGFDYFGSRLFALDETISGYRIYPFPPTLPLGPALAHHTVDTPDDNPANDDQWAAVQIVA